MVYSRLLLQQKWLRHGFGEKGFDTGRLAAIIASVHRTRQVHGDRVCVLDDVDIGRFIVADAFVASRRRLVCLVRTADCVPILIADIEKHVVAAVHSGWRGTSLRIVSKTIACMRQNFGCQVGSIVAAVGPCICGNCYVVGDDVIEVFERRGFDINKVLRRCPDGWSLDLAAVNIALLMEEGVKQIDVIGECTYENHSRFYSYRFAGDKLCGRQSNFIVHVS